MAATGKSKYDESKIKTLSSLEHIRLRTGMYIGRLGDGSNPDDGIYVLLKEVVDNSIDEFIMGAGSRIEIQISPLVEEAPATGAGKAAKSGGKKVASPQGARTRISIRDYGRGIPLGKVIDCVSIINTGAKYNDDVFQFSVGLNGVGTKAVNALSEHFRVVSHRGGEYFEAVFSRGVLVSKKHGATREKTGTLIEFIPDPEIFGDYAFNREFVEHRAKN
ncbi:MAG: hypothetical protein WCL50_03705, partial [Spirochaetota bacterium]